MARKEIQQLVATKLAAAKQKIQEAQAGNDLDGAFDHVATYTAYFKGASEALTAAGIPATDTKAVTAAVAVLDAETQFLEAFEDADADAE